MPRDDEDLANKGPDFFPGMGSKATALERIAADIEVSLEKGYSELLPLCFSNDREIHCILILMCEKRP